MIVEDDEDLAEGICLSLQSPELTFVRAGTIEEAEKQRKEQKFDLLILDINLPDGSGLDFCRQIREQSRVPIALLTARDMEIDIVSGLECGADDYITKPFSLMVLRARIRALLRRNVSEQKSEYRKGCFIFCLTRMEFYKEGRPVELSKTERRILQLLVFHEGQVITRDRLMEWVWPDGTEYVEDNALSVGIRRLRDKLEDAPSRPQYIRTVLRKRICVGVRRTQRGKEMKEIYFYIFCVLAAAVFATAGILFSRAYDRKKMHNLYEALLNRLDRAIGGGWQEEKYDESLDNAIAEAS